MGVCILTDPNRGTLKGHESKEITITVYNDICGIFKDTLICEIEGLAPKKLPTKVKISGSPVVVDKC